MDKFDRILSSVIDSHLGFRSTLTGYQYSEIIRAVFSVFFCGGDCMEDLNLYLKDVLAERPHTRVPSADCGSYSEDIVKMVMEHTDKLYIRAERYAGLYEKVKRQTGWKLREFIVQLVVQFIVQSIILFDYKVPYYYVCKDSDDFSIFSPSNDKK